MALLKIEALKVGLDVAKAVRDFAVGIKDAKALHRKIGVRVLSWIDAQFKTEGRQAGSRAVWPPLRPSTIAGRRKQSSKVLQDTGGLKASFTDKPTADEVRVGTPLQIAKYHEFGTRGPYPIRPVRAKALRFVTGREVGFQEAALSGTTRSGKPKLRVGQIIRTGVQVRTTAAGGRFGERFAKFIERGGGRFGTIERKTKLERFTFAKSVMHPGLPPRPMLPREEYAQRLASDIAILHVKEVADKAQLKIQASQTTGTERQT